MTSINMKKHIVITVLAISSSFTRAVILAFAEKIFEILLLQSITLKLQTGLLGFWVSAHLSVVDQRIKSHLGVWIEWDFEVIVAKNKHMCAECLWTRTIYFQLKVPRLLRCISMINVSVSFECSIADSSEKILYIKSYIV